MENSNGTDSISAFGWLNRVASSDGQRRSELPPVETDREGIHIAIKATKRWKPIEMDESAINAASFDC